MRHKQVTNAKHSLRTLLLFCSIVGFLIIGSLVVRTIQLVQTSQYNGENRITLAFVHENTDLTLISFDPKAKALSRLEVEGVYNIEDAKRAVGVFTDATVTLSQDYTPDKSFPSYLRASLFPSGVRSDLSSFDTVRLLLATQGLNTSEIKSEVIRLPLDRVLIDAITQELFFDTAMSEENSAIEIVNGTDTAGLGSRLERAISTMGGTVISVKNADKLEEVSSIRYYGDKTYTVERLEKILDMPSQFKEGRGLSDIIITVGEDKEETFSY